MTDLSSMVQELAEKLGTWLHDGILMLPNFLIAIVVVTLFGITAKYVRRLVERLLGKVSSNQAVNNLIATTAKLGFLVAGTFVALEVINLHETVMTLLAGVGIVGLALGFAFQDLAANFIAGIFMAVRKPFTIGDIIHSNDYVGIVKSITLRSTEIRTFRGQRVILPNKMLFENALENFSQGERRVDLAVGVSYGDDLDLVEELTLKAIKQLPQVKDNRPVDLFYDAFGDSSINFTVRYWIDFYQQTDFLKAQSEAIKAIKATYDKADITIPFPIRTLDFGIKGGEPLQPRMVQLEESRA